MQSIMQSNDLVTVLCNVFRYKFLILYPLSLKNLHQWKFRKHWLECGFWCLWSDFRHYTRTWIHSQGPRLCSMHSNLHYPCMHQGPVWGSPYPDHLHITDIFREKRLGYSVWLLSNMPWKLIKKAGHNPTQNHYEGLLWILQKLHTISTIIDLWFLWCGRSPTTWIMGAYCVTQWMVWGGGPSLTGDFG